MKALAKKWLWWLCVLLILAAGGYFLTFGHCFLPLPKNQTFAGKTIEIRDYEEFVLPPDSDTFSGALARAIWRFTCPGQVRFVEAPGAPTPYADSMSSGLQRDLVRLGYEFPHGCFAATESPKSKGSAFRWRIAHYPSVLDRIQKDLNVRLIASPPRTDLIDPGPKFQKSFEQADLIEFVIRGTDRYSSNHNVVTVDNWEDVRRFFEILQFVPYDKGSDLVCGCYGEEDVRAYSKGVLVGEFSLHHGTSVRWSPLETDIDLTRESLEALEEYLNQQVYGMKVPVKVLEKDAPMLGMRPFEMPAKNPINVENAEQYPGAGQPSTKPADKAPVKNQPSPPTSGDAPR